MDKWQENIMQEQGQSTNHNPNLSDRWVWMAVLVTAFYIIPATFLKGSSAFASFVIFLVCLSTLIAVDVKELKPYGLNEKKWFALGVLSIPAYALMRAVKTNGHFGPALFLIFLSEFVYLMIIFTTFGSSRW